MRCTNRLRGRLVGGKPRKYKHLRENARKARLALAQRKAALDVNTGALDVDDNPPSVDVSSPDIPFSDVPSLEAGTTNFVTK